MDVTRDVEDAVPYGHPITPNQIIGFDLERKTGGADMKTSGGDRSLPDGEMEQARFDVVGEGLAPPADAHRTTNGAKLFFRPFNCL